MLIPLRQELADNLDVFGDDPSQLVDNTREFTLHALLTRALGGTTQQHEELLPESVAAAIRHDDEVTVRDLTRLAVCGAVILESELADEIIADAKSRLPDLDELPDDGYEAVAVINAGLALALLRDDATAAQRWRSAQLEQPVGPHLVQAIVEMLYLSGPTGTLAAPDAAYVVYEAAIEAGDMMAPLVAGLRHRGVEGSELWKAVGDGLRKTDDGLFPAGKQEARATVRRVEWSVRDSLTLSLIIEGSGGPLTAPAPLVVPFLDSVPVRLQALKAGEVRVSQVKGLRKRDELTALLDGELEVEVISEVPIEPERPEAYRDRLDVALEWVRTSVDGVSLDGRLAFRSE